MGIAIHYNGIQYEENDLKHYTESHPALIFARDWLSGQNEFIISTSGSTGKPKEIVLKRAAMEASANRTLSYFGLKPGNKALLCMNASTVGSKMMVVRSLLGGLHLQIADPTPNPFQNIYESFDFVPLVPLQLKAAIEDPLTNPKLSNVKYILLGGAPVDESLFQLLKTIKPLVYHGYGMTETCSHIALRLLNGPDPSVAYEILDGIEVKLSADKSLDIYGDITDHRWIHTNDLVELREGNKFLWLGRKDFAINTGGHKVHPELVETAIERILTEINIIQNIQISWIADAKWGQKVVLVTEGKPLFNWETVRSLLKNLLKNYEIPKSLIVVEKLHKTEAGKRDRTKTDEEIGGR
ncbi:MAG: AMP-binding protein [Cyclobacteriaceae bacterium]|nr:AMP-binding protein [Cyclobacteriaceae bacterium]